MSGCYPEFAEILEEIRTYSEDDLCLSAPGFDLSLIHIYTYHAQLQSAEFASSMMKLGCYLFMAVVGLIGLSLIHIFNKLFCISNAHAEFLKVAEYWCGIDGVAWNCLLYTSRCV